MTRDEQMEADYYTKKNRTPMAPWHPGVDMSRVSVSQADREAGHPRPGDMIAWSEDDKGDRWLVSDTYFEQNYVKAADATPSEDVRALAIGIKESKKIGTDFRGGVTCVYCGHGADYLQDITHAINCPVSIAERILKEQS